jgi:protein-tyrosine kinase
MSRIHEALKKAAEERAAVRTADVVAPHPPATATVGREGTMDLTADVGLHPSQNSNMSSRPIDHLRFDDLRAHCGHPVWKLDPNLNVFSNPDLNAHGAEQFRTLRSRLYQLRSNQPLRTLLVTSATAGEGKTFVTTNLALAIVRQPDRRALIIDADLRCMRLHVPLGAPSAPGLTDYLRGEADEMAVIQQGHEGNLCLIPGGNQVTNPSELLSNGRLKKLLDHVASVFDWIIFDSPPCLPVADASILANLCDGTLLVVRAGMTPTEVAQRACQELQGKNVVGVVLNAVDETAAGYSYYYHNYGYVYGHNGSKRSKE